MERSVIIQQDNDLQRTANSEWDFVRGENVKGFRQDKSVSRR